MSSWFRDWLHLPVSNFMSEIIQSGTYQDKEHSESFEKRAYSSRHGDREGEALFSRRQDASGLSKTHMKAKYAEGGKIVNQRNVFMKQTPDGRISMLRVDGKPRQVSSNKVDVEDPRELYGQWMNALAKAESKSAWKQQNRALNAPVAAVVAINKASNASETLNKIGSAASSLVEQRNVTRENVTHVAKSVEKQLDEVAESIVALPPQNKIRRESEAVVVELAKELDKIKQNSPTLSKTNTAGRLSQIARIASTQAQVVANQLDEQQAEQASNQLVMQVAPSLSEQVFAPSTEEEEEEEDASASSASASASEPSISFPAVSAEEEEEEEASPKEQVDTAVVNLLRLSDNVAKDVLTDASSNSSRIARNTAQLQAVASTFANMTKQVSAVAKSPAQKRNAAEVTSLANTIQAMSNIANTTSQRLEATPSGTRENADAATQLITLTNSIKDMATKAYQKLRSMWL